MGAFTKPGNSAAIASEGAGDAVTNVNPADQSFTMTALGLTKSFDCIGYKSFTLLIDNLYQPPGPPTPGAIEMHIFRLQQQWVDPTITPTPAASGPANKFFIGYQAVKRFMGVRANLNGRYLSISPITNTAWAGWNARLILNQEPIPRTRAFNTNDFLSSNSFDDTVLGQFTTAVVAINTTVTLDANNNPMIIGPFCGRAWVSARGPAGAFIQLRPLAGSADAYGTEIPALEFATTNPASGPMEISLGPVAYQVIVHANATAGAFVITIATDSDGA